MKITTLSFLALALVQPAFAAEPTPSEATFIDHTIVEQAFTTGKPVLVNSRYKVQTGRRVKAGEVEFHEHDTDIFYVLEGTATFVTGGKIEGSRTTGPGEIRGKKIAGGVTHHLAKGDVIVVPAGVPHWFTEVGGTFLYLVVKVTQ